jgi:aspartate racemase
VSRVIGILGGMGPRATVEFEQRLLSSLSGGDQDLPKVLTINDGSIPDRSSFLVGNGEDPVPKIQSNLESLESMGAEVVCIPCNTAHAKDIFGRLSPNQSKLLNLPQLVLQEIVDSGCTKPLLLATRGTISAGVYEHGSVGMGLNLILPDENTQKAVDSVIANVKAGVGASKQAQQQVGAFARSSTADCIILGCTELPLAFTQSDLPLKSFDTIQILVQSALNERN